MNDSKAIFTLLRAILEKRIAGCECRGSGWICTVDSSYQLGQNHPCAHFVKDGDCSANENDCAWKRPCPTCAKDRAMLEVVCWHEWMDVSATQFRNFSRDMVLECTCGRTVIYNEEKMLKYMQSEPDWFDIIGCRHPTGNPDLTTDMTGTRLTLVDMLASAGEWPGFLEWHNEQIELVCYGNTTECVCFESVADILTDGALLVPAVKSYLEEV